MNYVKGAAKWLGIAAGFYVIGLLLADVTFETKVFLMFAGLAMAVAYLDGTFKDRIADLEYKVDRLRRQLNGDY